MPYLTATANVELPLRLAGVRRGTRRRRAGELLELLGVGHCAGRRPDQMSGGEQQRVAIGVALANSPSVLLADEPTGELDSATATSVFAALQTANAELPGVTGARGDPRPGGVSSMVRRVIAIGAAGRAPRRCGDGSITLMVQGTRSSTRSSTGPGGCSFPSR